MGAVPASSLMLVKAANVDEAARTVTEIVPVNKITGHMCGLHIRNMENSVKDGRFLLVDDICTTGSTLGEAARVLRQAGAADVLGLTLAITREE